MLIEELFDPAPVLRQLLLERAQQARTTLRQKTLGRDLRRRTGKFRGPIKESQARFQRLRTPEPLRVQPLLPFAFARFVQSRRRREAQDEAPGRQLRPVAESLERRRKIFTHRLLELIDQGGALLNQRAFVSGEQTQ